MSVEYVYPDNVQAVLTEIEAGVKREKEWLAKQLECTKCETVYAASINMQFILNEYDNRVTPLMEAKNRIVSNALPIQIIITKQEQTDKMNDKQEIYNLSATSIK